MRFWINAQTFYRVHSPLAFAWADAVLEDRRYYYAFDHIEALRRQMLRSDLRLEQEDYGRPAEGKPLRRRVALRRLAERASSPPRQGRWLFRTVRWLRPKRVVELGTAVGIGTAYLAAGAGREAKIASLEGCPNCARIAATHLEMLGLNHNVCIRSGPFARTLPDTLREMGQVDLVFFDGHHQAASTLAYFEQCLPYAHSRTLFVFDDIYASEEMTAAWSHIRQHERLTLTVDCFDLAFAFFHPEVREKQHLRLVPTQWKPWAKFL